MRIMTKHLKIVMKNDRVYLFSSEKNSGTMVEYVVEDGILSVYTKNFVYNYPLRNVDRYIAEVDHKEEGLD